MIKSYSITVKLFDPRFEKRYRETVVVDTTEGQAVAEKQAIEAVLSKFSLGYDSLKGVKTTQL